VNANGASILPAGYSVSPASPADVERLLNLERLNMKALMESLYPGCWDEQRLRDEFREQLATTFVIRHGAKFVGFCRWAMDDASTAVLYSVQVEPDHQRKGVGTFAISEFELQARKSGATRAALGVHSRNPAQRLYSRMGYEVTKPDGPHAVAMEKSL
jgi:ribosomal protein S18 acetylase RimI-like enzyme